MKGPVAVIPLVQALLLAKAVSSWTTLPTCAISRTESSTRLFDEIPSLYKEQEKLLVSRGEFEGKLMGNNRSPIEANVIKGVGSGGGFGSKKGGSKSQMKEQGKAHAKVLKEQGVVRIDNVLPPDLADEVREFLFNLRKDSEEKVKNGELQSLERFADVLLKTNRCDLTLPVPGPKVVADALYAALQTSPVGATIAALLGEDAILYELSCIMSDPGSQRQVMHPDTPYNKNNEPVLYTCFMALQDVDLNMGPTTWMPGTHTLASHELFQDEDERSGESRKDFLLRTGPSVLGLLPKGSCGIFDSRLLHCGGANTSENCRAILYFTFRNPKVGYVGNPGSIRPDLISKFTLASLDKELKKYAKGKASEIFAQ
jgi:hypothetical protein